MKKEDQNMMEEDYTREMGENKIVGTKETKIKRRRKERSHEGEDRRR
jgi:hypothetical protein